MPEHVNGLRKKKHIVFFGDGPARAWTDSNIQNEICLCVLLRIPMFICYLLFVLHSQSFPGLNSACCFKSIPALLFATEFCIIGVGRNWNVVF